MTRLDAPQEQVNQQDVVDFLLDPERDHSGLDTLVTQRALQEIESLDGYLKAQVGSLWEDEKARHALRLRASHWSELWPPRVAARLFLIERERGNSSWPEALRATPDSLRMHVFDAGMAGERNIVVSGAFLNLELTRTFHPSTIGARLFCETPVNERLEDISHRCRTALDFLAQQDPLGFAVFTKSVTAIAPLALEPVLEAGKCFSMAIGTAPGLVLLTIGPLVLLAETLLHEAAHNRLSAADSLARLWHNGSLRVKSPLRTDARPISGLYHQAYVLFHLCRYYSRVESSTGEPAVTRNRRQIAKRSREFSECFRAAVDTLRSHAGQLTSLGIDVLDAMAVGIAA